MIEIILSGGWMMIPLLVCSVIAIGVAMERFLAFWQNSQIDTRSLRAKVLKLMEEGQVDEAARICSNTPGPVSAVMLVGLQSYRRHINLTHRPESITTIMEKAMDDYAQHAVSAVEKRLGVLSTIGNAAPLLGMTGTVTGMIASFEGFANAGGLDQGGVVASGIAEALTTTAAGLIIALIAVIPYNYFAARSDAIDLEIEEATTELIDFVATRLEGEAAQPVVS